MNVIVHYPTTEQAMRELQRKVAEVHAEAVTSKINKLTCPKEQKIELIKAVQNAVKNQ